MISRGACVHVVVAYIVMPYIVMAYIWAGSPVVTAYVVIAYVVVAWISGDDGDLGAGDEALRRRGAAIRAGRQGLRPDRRWINDAGYRSYYCLNDAGNRSYYTLPSKGPDRRLRCARPRSERRRGARRRDSDEDCERPQGDRPHVPHRHRFGRGLLRPRGLGVAARLRDDGLRRQLGGATHVLWRVGRRALR